MKEYQRKRFISTSFTFLFCEVVLIAIEDITYTGIYKYFVITLVMYYVPNRIFLFRSILIWIIGVYLKKGFNFIV